jgi:preprotein translocase subunit SecE
VGRVLTVTLGIVAFLAVLAIVLYLLDEALGWGLFEAVSGLW